MHERVQTAGAKITDLVGLARLTDVERLIPWTVAIFQQMYLLPGKIGLLDASALACIATANPRADQIAAQNGCIQNLESGDLGKNCKSIRENCRDVDPILESEPLYGFLRNTDDDGVVGEDL